MDIVSNNVTKDIQILIYSIGSVSGLLVGLLFIPYFSLIKFNILFLTLSLVSFLFGFFSGIYLEYFIRKKAA